MEECVNLLLVDFGLMGAIVGCATADCADLPVSMQKEKPRMGRRTPAAKKASQLDLIMDMSSCFTAWATVSEICKLLVNSGRYMSSHSSMSSWVGITRFG